MPDRTTRPLSDRAGNGEAPEPASRAEYAALVAARTAAGAGIPRSAAIALLAGEVLLDDLLHQTRTEGAPPSREAWLRSLTTDGMVALIHVLCAALAGDQDALDLSLRLSARLVAPRDVAARSAPEGVTEGPITGLLTEAVATIAFPVAALRALL